MFMFYLNLDGGKRMCFSFFHFVPKVWLLEEIQLVNEVVLVFDMLMKIAFYLGKNLSFGKKVVGFGKKNKFDFVGIEMYLIPF